MLASNHFPICSPQSGSLRDVHGVTQRSKEGGRRSRWPGRYKGGIKRRETDPANNQFPVFSIARNSQRDSRSEVEKRRGREEIEVTWGRKGRVKRGENNKASNHTP